ncbi:MAG: glycosyltransferase family 2 protein [Proteobacteria bacterium]|nr:glycosyltransferase family 2 protein [Pseudomonadota bacterium]
MKDVAVLIPTLRRPDSLTRALRSVFAQAQVAERLLEVVVIDNDPNGSAKFAVGALERECPVPLIYVHEETPGVATARNAGLKATGAAFIAFLDDDEEATEAWLASLLETQSRFDADAVFGPIAGLAPDAPEALRPWLKRFFSREGPMQSGPIDHGYGCGNSLLKRETVLIGERPFDVRHDQIGGEDDALFSALQARGGRFAWAADALVFEHAPAHRATLAYALTRGFAYGQGPSQTAARERRWGSVAKWMAVGAAQAAVYGPLAAIQWLMGAESCWDTLDRMVRGLGKVFWTERFEPKVYGQAEVARNAAAELPI